MKHIATTSEAEKNAKKEYTKVKEGTSVEADARIEENAYELFSVLKQIDQLQLRASELKGEIMAAMKDGAQLKSRTGKILVTWIAGSMSKSVDYAGIFKKYKVTDEDIKAFTTFKQGARKFTVELDD
jgi:predicted phage-related endonuclease